MAARQCDAPLVRGEQGRRGSQGYHDHTANLETSQLILASPVRDAGSGRRWCSGRARLSSSVKCGALDPYSPFATTQRFALSGSHLTFCQARSSIVRMNEREVLRRHLSRLGKKGGPKGGRARMASLTATER